MSDNSALIVAALEATAPELAQNLDARNSLRSEIQLQGARVATYRRYERGDHKADLTTEMKAMLRIKSDAAKLEEFNDNYCRVVVDKMASRVRTSGISINDQAIDWLNELLERNDWQSLQSRLWRGAIRDGDSYVIIDPATLLWSAEPAYDGYSGVYALGDPSDPIWACKLWSESAKISSENQEDDVEMHIIVYQLDYISYWKGKPSDTEVEPDLEGDIENYSVWGLEHLPVIHFVNQFDSFSSFGESELRVVIPLQNALNRTLHSMLMASEFAAFPLRYSIGLEIKQEGIVPGTIINLVPKDASGNKITKYTPALAEFLRGVQVGQFEATDMGQYITQIEQLAREISQASQTPIYGVTTEGNLSGEALRQLEIGLIGKIERFQFDNSDNIKSLIALTAEIHSNFDTTIWVLPSPGKVDDIGVEWHSPELLDDNQKITMLLDLRGKSSGLFPDSFYRERIGGILGLSSEEIEALGEEAIEEQTEKMDRIIGAGGKSNPPISREEEDDIDE